MMFLNKNENQVGLKVNVRSNSTSKVYRIFKDLVEYREKSYGVYLGRNGNFPVIGKIYLPKSHVSAVINNDIVTLTVPEWILKSKLRSGIDMIRG